MNTCVICGTTFQRKSAWKSKTCSKRCRYKSASISGFKQIKRICATCNKEFTIPPCWIKKNRGNDGTYCSKKCRWKKKISYTKKQKISAGNAIHSAIKSGELETKNCQVCDDPKSEAHHYKGYDKKNWFNVNWLCRTCHKREHERMRKIGLLYE